MPQSLPPSADADARPVRIDRRDLAHDRQVWLIYAVVFAIVGFASLLIPLLWPSLFARERLWPFAAVLLMVAATTAVTRPPRLGGIRNHLVIVNVTAMAALGLIAYAPSAMAPAAAAMFAGTFAAGRLIDRRQLLAHYAVGTVLLLIPVLFVDLDRATLLALISILPGVWVLGWATTLILEAAEAQSQELASLVRRDPLTGVGNRRLLDEALTAEIAAHAASSRELSVLALDLNGFKALNDRVGHDAGDALLRAVAAALVRAVGSGDLVVRQGGDEFCILLPGSGPTEAAAVRESITAALGALGHRGEGVTTGIGLATFPADATTPAGLLEFADARLSDDKAAHRRAPRALPTEVSMPVMPLSTPATPGHGSMRVSRRQFAVNLTVWRAQGVLVTLYSLMLGLIALFTLDGADPQRTAFAFCTVLSAVAYFTLRRQPPAVGTALNHAVVALPYVGSSLFMIVVPSIASAAIGPLALSGALASVRLVDRRQIIAHWVAATLCSVGLAASGIVDVPTMLAILLVVVINWGIGAGDMIYLERSEEQGDELERLVRRDPLTGVGNRRLLGEVLEEEVARAARSGRPLSVLALDLNGFKPLNDRLGHAAGDELLCDVAAALATVARDGDTVVRQGGDEFCVLLPETDGAEALPIANALRAAVSRLSRDGHRITTGVGIATYPTEANDGDVLLYVADERLREDKAHGNPGERRQETRAPDRPSLTLLGDADQAAV